MVYIVIIYLYTIWRCIMSNNNTQNNGDSKKITSILILIATLMIVTTGSTYAYFAISATSNNVITGTAATADLSLEASMVSPNSASLTNSTQVMVPQLNTALGSAINRSNPCIDDNQNVVCYVMKIVIRNNSSARVVLNGDLTFKSSGTFATDFPNLYWKPLTNATTVNTSAYGPSFYFKASTDTVSDLANTKTNSRLVGSALTVSTITLNPANSTTCTTTAPTATTTSTTPGSCVATYFIAIWINERNEAQSDSGTWYASVTFNSSNGTGVTSTITS